MKIQRVAIVPYTGHIKVREQTAHSLTIEVQNWLTAQGVTVAIRRQDMIGFTPDLIAVLGGDGWFIHTVKEFMHLQVPFLGVNFGTKGFLLPIIPSYFRAFLQQLLAGKEPKIETRSVIEACVYQGGVKTAPFICVNEVLVKSDFYMISLEVQANGQVIMRPRADGVIVATPTGSTAYNFNAGGPLLRWDSSSFAITAIACGDRRDACCTEPDSKTIKVRVLTERAAFIPDGYIGAHGPTWLKPGDFVEIKRSGLTFQTTVPPDLDSYYQARQKLYD